MSRADHPAERVREASAFTRAAVAWAETEELAAVAVWALALHELGDLWRAVRP